MQDLICGRALELPGLQDRDYPLHLGIGLAVLWPTIAIILVSMHVRSRRAERS